MFELIAYLFKLGFPLMAITWWLFHRMYSRGQIDRSLSQAGVRASIKAMHENYSRSKKASRQAAKQEKISKKAAKKAASKEEILQDKEAAREAAIDIREAAIKAGAERRERFDSGEYLESNWMKFGGGFYGLTALYTFFAIEIFDLVGLLFDWSALAALFDQGLIDLAIDFLMNQIGNVVVAFVWFNYWPGPGDSMLLGIAVAYGAYLSGIELARRGIKPDLNNLEQAQSAAIKQIDQTRSDIKQGIEKIRSKADED